MRYKVTIDGNALLRACASVALDKLPEQLVINNSTHINPNYRGRGIIAKVFLQMVTNQIIDMLKEGLKIENLVILWDKRIVDESGAHYYKGKALNKYYEGLRKLYFDDDNMFVGKEETKLDDKYVDQYFAGHKGDRETTVDMSTLSPVEQMKEMKRQRLADIKYNEFLQARILVQNKLDASGINSFYVEGLEADDIDYVFSLLADREEGKGIIHFTSDSDWKFHLRPNDISWQYVRSKLYKKDYEEISQISPVKGLTPFDWVTLSQSSLGSHNNLKRVIDRGITKLTKKYKEPIQGFCFPVELQANPTGFTFKEARNDELVFTHPGNGVDYYFSLNEPSLLHSGYCEVHHLTREEDSSTTLYIRLRTRDGVDSGSFLLDCNFDGAPGKNFTEYVRKYGYNGLRITSMNSQVYIHFNFIQDYLVSEFFQELYQEQLNMFKINNFPQVPQVVKYFRELQPIVQLDLKYLESLLREMGVADSSFTGMMNKFRQINQMLIYNLTRN